MSPQAVHTHAVCIILACHECDALQQVPAVHVETDANAGANTHCWRCDAPLLQGKTMHLERMLALAVTALILFVVANSFPLFALELQDTHQQTSLFGAVRTLWVGDLSLVALLVLATTILAPLLEIFMLIYVLGAFRLGLEHEAPGLVWLLRVQALLKPWNMIEVFMLGSLVALVKLSHVADIHVGIAVWSFAGVMLLLAAVSATFDARQLWDRLGNLAEHA